MLMERSTETSSPVEAGRFAPSFALLSWNTSEATVSNSHGPRLLASTNSRLVTNWQMSMDALLEIWHHVCSFLLEQGQKGPFSTPILDEPERKRSVLPLT